MFIAKIEFLRIQTFLFASYRLRAMLGANSLLGRVIRQDLVKLAKDHGAQTDEKLVELLPKADKHDPLSQIHDPLLQDNPRKLYQDYGVISRDGGHLHATFKARRQAQAFIEDAIRMVNKKLPDLLVEGRIVGPNQQNEEDFSDIPKTSALFSHNTWQVCQRTGRFPAAKAETHFDGEHPVWISLMQDKLEAAGRKFRQNPQDLIGILESNRLIPIVESDEQASSRQLEDVASRGYLAVVHTDGNNMGGRFKRFMDTCPHQDGLLREACAETFFYSMRVAVRRALTEALKIQLDPQPQAYQLMMLGGDDLLLVCDADLALPFLIDYAKQLKQLPLADGKPLSIGAGVVIAKKTFPFYRLHTLAEELADSAKRYFRALQQKQAGEVSVVDWLVTSQSWEDHALSTRRTHYAGKPVCASLKPYPLIEQPDSTYHSLTLETMHQKALSLQPQVARSQLKRLQNALRKADMAEIELLWNELPQQMRKTLEDEKNGISLWCKNNKDDLLHLSALDDLIELMEIAHLGRKEAP